MDPTSWDQNIANHIQLAESIILGHSNDVNIKYLCQSFTANKAQRYIADIAESRIQSASCSGNKQGQRVMKPCGLHWENRDVHLAAFEVVPRPCLIARDTPHNWKKTHENSSRSVRSPECPFLNLLAPNSLWNLLEVPYIRVAIRIIPKLFRHLASNEKCKNLLTISYNILRPISSKKWTTQLERAATRNSQAAM